MSTDLLDTVKELFRQRDAQRADDFAEMVVKIARGETVEAEDVSAMLDESGKTPDDLAREVSRVQGRIQDRRQIVEFEKEWARLPRLRAQIAEAEAAFEAAKVAHARAIGPLIDEADSIGRQGLQPRITRQDMAEGCKDARLTARYAEIRYELNPLLRRQAEIGDEAEHLRSNIARSASIAGVKKVGPDEWEEVHSRQAVNDRLHPGDIRDAQALIAKSKAKLQVLTNELGSINTRIDELQTEAAEVHAEMIASDF